MRPLSSILKEISETQLRDANASRTLEAASLTLYLSNLAWNESVGICFPRASCLRFCESLESENPQLWSELVSKDMDQMIDAMLRYKDRHFSSDRRRILTCGIVEGKIRVEWLQPAAPGVDAEWELRMFGLLRTGRREDAIELMESTRGIPKPQAASQVHDMELQLEHSISRF